MKNAFAKLKWYVSHPQYYGEFFRVGKMYSKELLGLSKNTEKQQHQAKEWCERYAVNTTEALRQIIGKSTETPLDKVFPVIFEAARKSEKDSPVKMGGGGNIHLLYHLCEFINAKQVIETGVAYGWSSLALLLSLQTRPNTLLISTDKPYPGMDNEQQVGCVVPQELRKHWKLVRGSDRDMLPKILKTIPEKIPYLDLCHYDSDKTYEGRSWAYPLLWQKLRKGGWFVSDDISDNLAFHDFCRKVGKKPIIVKTSKNYVGLLQKENE